MSRMIFRVLFALILVAVLAGAGVWVYNAGVSQGMLASGSLPAISATPGAAGAYPYPYYPGYYRPWGFGFFPFGFIIPFLFILFFFFAIRGMIFGGMMHRGMRRWGGMGPWGDPSGSNPGGIPPMVVEWHRRMHGEQPNQTDQPGQNKP